MAQGGDVMLRDLEFKVFVTLGLTALAYWAMAITEAFGTFG